MTCQRAQEFLAQHDIQTDELIDAKNRLGPDDALALARRADLVLCAKGKKLVRFDMRTDPDPDELLQNMLGPTGNLRAPAIRRGRTLIIGFSPDAYAEHLL